MQSRLRDEIDADRVENYVSVSELRSAGNEHEINCSVCAKTFYADNWAYESIRRGIEEGSDNPFICDNCQSEYDELAYGGH